MEKVHKKSYVGVVFDELKVINILSTVSRTNRMIRWMAKNFISGEEKIVLNIYKP